MGLNKVKGNMYGFITHTWNPIQGRCNHNCKYCYMNTVRDRYKKFDTPVQLRENYFNDNLGHEKYIFIGSSTDIFADDVPLEWILRVFDYAKLFDNNYLIQTKNQFRAIYVIGRWNIPVDSVLCTTLETNRYHIDLYSDVCPSPIIRAAHFKNWADKKMITIEPIMDFDPILFSEMIINCEPFQVNIGADSGGNKLPEPPREKIEELIELLAPYTTIHLKKNLRRILPESRYYGTT